MFWYDRLDAQTIIDMAPDEKIRDVRKQIVAKAKERIGDYLYPQISEEIAGRRRLIRPTPALFHINPDLEPEHEAIVHEALKQYRYHCPMSAAFSSIDTPWKTSRSRLSELEV